MDNEKIVEKLKDIGEKAVDVGKSVKNVKKLRLNVQDFFINVQANGKFLFVAIFAAVVVMVFFGFLVFFLNVKGPEEVLVPDVRYKELADALIEMQTKELYPKITLRYSDVPGDAGTILEQNPSPGAIVKGYSRVNLVVSRGVVVDEVENYVGLQFDELQMQLQTLFAGQTKHLIVLDTPIYKADVADAGTILEQDPPEGTRISEPIKLKLIVSRGPNFENTRPPYLVGKTIEEVLGIVQNSKIIFDFTSHKATNDETAGTVTSQQQFESEFMKNYSRMTVDIAFPRMVVNNKLTGIFSAEVAEYPYPVPFRLEATDASGTTTIIANILHTGGSFTMPYTVDRNTTLTLFIVDKAVKKVTVH